MHSSEIKRPAPGDGADQSNADLQCASHGAKVKGNLIIHRSDLANGFARIDHAALSDARLKWADKGILVWLMNHRDGWNLNINHLIEQSPDGKAAVYASLNRLEAFGYYRKEQERGKAGTFHPPVYHVHIPPLTGYPLPDNQETVKPLTENQETVASPLTGYPLPDNRTLTRIIDNKNKNTPLPPSGDGEGQSSDTLPGIDLPKEQKDHRTEKPTDNRKARRFEDFWRAYPNKQGKAKAKRTWQKRKLDTIADKIIADVVKRSKEHGPWLKDGGQYIPHGSTYVNNEGWADAIQTGNATGNTNIMEVKF